MRGRVELVEQNRRGELTVQAYVDHPEARRCNAFGARCGGFSATPTPVKTPERRSGFREISLVPLVDRGRQVQGSRCHRRP
jgi:hypothetical protein